MRKGDLVRLHHMLDAAEEDLRIVVRYPRPPRRRRNGAILAGYVHLINRARRRATRWRLPLAPPWNRSSPPLSPVSRGRGLRSRRGTYTACGSCWGRIGGPVVSRRTGARPERSDARERLALAQLCTG